MIDDKEISWWRHFLPFPTLSSPDINAIDKWYTCGQNFQLPGCRLCQLCDLCEICQLFELRDLYKAASVGAVELPALAGVKV